jgi:hypothetical protein
MDPASALYSPHRSPDGAAAIADLLAEWQAVDQLALRLSEPGS